MYTIKSESSEGIYYLSCNWKKNDALWVKKEMYRKSMFFKSIAGAKGSLSKLLKECPEYADDVFVVVNENFEVIEVVTKELKSDIADSVRRIMGKYYDNHTGTLVIPIKTISVEESACLVELMRKGCVLSAYNDGEDNYYVLYENRLISFAESIDESIDVRNFTKEYNKYLVRNICDCIGWLDNEFAKHDMQIEKGFTIGEYNGDFGEVIDAILIEASLLNNAVNGWSVCLALRGNNFMFVESYELGY